jgi:hypothetical protein
MCTIKYSPQFYFVIERREEEEKREGGKVYALPF